MHLAGELSLLLGHGGAGVSLDLYTQALRTRVGPQGEGVPGLRAQAADGDGWFFITASQVLPAPCVEILFIP